MRLLRVLLALVLAASLAGPALADDRPGPRRPLERVYADPWNPGKAYSGDFPDPSVIRVGTRYYAFSTTVEDLNLPMVRTADLVHWTARAATAGNPRGDALLVAPRWARRHRTADGRLVATTWAPTVTRLRSGRFVLAYAVEVAGARRGHMCISLAHSWKVNGPYTDRSSRPLLCPPRGAIDPQVYLSPSGQPWMTWRLDLYPARIYTRRLNATATGFVAGDSHHLLLGVTQPWEGSVVENPAMIRYAGRWYLLYSANDYASDKYAVGYAVCRHWFGDCRKPRGTPLLASGDGLAGPGGASPFVGTHGQLRMAYHAWRAGSVGYATSDDCQRLAGGCPQRRLYVARLGVLADGALVVRDARADR